MNYLDVRLKAGERWRYEPRKVTPSLGSLSIRAP